MLYLIIDAYLDESLEPRKCLKIGYAKNIDDRMVGYGTSNNLNVILLDSREGGYGLEKLFHYYYKDKIINLKGNREWMEYDETIISGFKELTKKELFLNYYSDPKEKLLRELIFNYFIKEDNDFALDEIVNFRKSQQFSIIDEFLESSFFFKSDIVYLINELQYLFKSTLDTINQGLFIKDFCQLFEVKDDEFKNVSKELIDDCLALEKVNVLNQLRESYRSNGAFEDKMKEVCLILLDPKWSGYIHISDLFWIKLTQRNYLYILGPERIKNIGYKESDIKREIFSLYSKDLVKSELIKNIIIKKRYNLKELKEIIQSIYNLLGISKTAKAKDIEEYYEVKTVKVIDPDNPEKRVNGYEILSLK